MSDTTSTSGYTDYERELLGTYFSVVDGPEHADIYLVHNLPAEVAATLNGVYSRSSKSMRDQFLDRLRQASSRRASSSRTCRCRAPTRTSCPR